MQFSPTKLLHGLLYTAPVMLLTLVACGGGGGSDVTLASAYTLGGYVSGLTVDGLTLRNNGGDNLNVTSGVSDFQFATRVVAATNYNVTVLTHPSASTAHQKCLVTNPSGTMPAYDLPASGAPNVTVTCVDAYTIGGNISGLTGSGLVLQNNNGDNLQVPAGASAFTFSTPLVNGASYSVTLINQPNPQFCNLGGTTVGTVGTSNITPVTISCSTGASLKDKYAYVANFGSNTVSSYSINATSGVLTFSDEEVTGIGTGPSSVAVDSAGKFAYVTNQTSNTLSAYSIASGVLTALPDVDSGTAGIQTSIPTGPTPIAIKIHPSGKFAYVVNQGNNSVSAYSVDAASGVARIDSDGGTAGNQTSIPARSGPISIAFHPEGGYAYVANSVSGDISVYRVDNGISGVGATGTLSTMDANGPSNSGSDPFIHIGGATPYSVAVNPDGGHLYVADAAGVIRSYVIGDMGTADEGALISTPINVSAGTGPRSVAVHPSGLYAYVVNGGSNDISGFDTSGGGLTAMPDIDAVMGGSQSTIATGTAPISISIDKSGTFAYVANYGTTGNGNTVTVYEINSSGLLTFKETKVVGTGPTSVATAP